GRAAAQDLHRQGAEVRAARAGVGRAVEPRAGLMDAWSEVADRVFVRRHRSLDLNAVLVVGDGACLVVDTRYDEVEGTELATAVRTVTPHPWQVVNTHFHYDHAF